MRSGRLILFTIVLSTGLVHSSLYFDRNSGYGSHARNFVDPRTEEPTGTTQSSTTSNLGCFLCTQMMSVTKQRVGLSQAQLEAVLNDRCKSLPTVIRSQCHAFVDNSLPKLYRSFSDDMSTNSICEILDLCDVGNPFAATSATAEKSTTDPTTEPTASSTATFPSTAFPSTAFPSTEVPTSTVRKGSPRTYNIVSTTTTSAPKPRMEKVAPAKELLPESSDNTTSKRLTCLFCERMLANAKNYAFAAKSEIAAFANATCAKLRDATLLQQCYQLTDRKINELAIFVDEQVVEALWCAQTNHC
uniref:Saposin B-type domain-containing protein n=1 Tax=Steinernema glaseri TaxID=37863 RepID=A0A1I7YLV4_9BILA